MRNVTADVRPPILIGVLGARPPPTAWFTNLKRVIRKELPGYWCLPFEVEARYLKNTIACMRLMDIAAIFVHGTHRRKILRYLPRPSAATKCAGHVDLIVRRRSQWIGLALPQQPAMLVRALSQHLSR